MKKLIIIASLIALALVATGCGKTGVQESGEQKYYVADLVGDPSNRNVFRSTTVWSKDAVFELLLPDYWEVKEDTENKYNTDIYISSNEYADDSCIFLPGTVGHGVDNGLEVEEWATLIPWGVADDFYFYKKISDEERRPVMRVVQFQDEKGNYYTLEMHFPEEGDYTSCHEDFSNIVVTFNTLDTDIEESYVEEEIFQPKWIALAIKNKESDEDRLVVDYPPGGWIVEQDENGLDYMRTEDNTCSVHGGMADIDVSTLEGYEETVLVLDNNDMAKKYTLYGEDGSIEDVYVIVTHNDITYNFHIDNLVSETCEADGETIIKSFRTYKEQKAVSAGIEMVEDKVEN